ncbi:uncharacterized protein [Apostichopus japonicus]|uniref:uncharacterized protein n=1 Tax=Stichopus japonicus TaxID=307972 RepID=UPI003AB57EB0
MKVLLTFLVVVVAVEAAYQENACSSYEHSDYGCTGQCMDNGATACPGGNTISGLCPQQANHVKCCFTADSDTECTNYNHPTAGSVGHCIDTSSCPNGYYISGLCPTKAAGIKCCFDKPTGTCGSGGGVGTQPGPVPSDCMACICEVESNCNENIGCRWDVNSDSCGPFQIKNDYYSDAKLMSNNLGTDWVSCTTEQECAERTVQAYMSRYATSSRIGYTPGCEEFARIHNGGPNGYLYSSTDGYWSKVSACL